MTALSLTQQWPVATVAAAWVGPDNAVHTTGDVHHTFRLASISKMIVGWAALIAVEERVIDLDTPCDTNGRTLRELLSHAGGYAFDGEQPIAAARARRIYSNTGIEHAADAVATAAGMPFGTYLRDAILEPLGMHATSLKGSPAYAIHSTVNDLLQFVAELRAPTLLHSSSALAFRTAQFPQLAGLVPGVGRFDPCPWGLGAELRGTKSPHWTGSHNSAATFGHFGGAGTLLWVDPGAEVACIALTDRPFDEWSSEALTLWPAFADAVLHDAGAVPL